MQPRYLSAALAFVLAFAAHSATAREIRPGDSWSYSVRNELTGEAKGVFTYVVTEASEAELVVRFGTPMNPNAKLIVFTPNWDRVEDAPWRWAPNDGAGIREPLEPGLEWTFESTSVAQASLLPPGSQPPTGGAAYSAKGVSRVVTRETIEVRAGRFEDVYRIETNVRSLNATGQGPVNETTTVTWYSPDINRW